MKETSEDLVGKFSGAVGAYNATSLIFDDPVEQVGSSTMPHKRNPIGFEGVKSLWKRFMLQAVTMHLDQISEHQRDLTNSASQRYTQELLVVFDYCIRRLRRISERLVVDREKCEKIL